MPATNEPWALAASVDSATLPLWLVLVCAYLLGSVPFGLVVVRWRKGIDLRTVGSGNIGATNAMRVVGRAWGVAVFFADFLKGLLPVLLLAPFAAAAEGRMLAQVLAGIAAVLGHCFPVWLAFRGGKGVATASGAIVAIDPLVWLIGGLVWLVTLKTSRYVGLASVLMGLTFPIAAWIRHPGGWPFVLGTILVAALIVVRHRANLSRILRGVEPRSGAKNRASLANGEVRNG